VLFLSIDKALQKGKPGFMIEDAVFVKHKQQDYSQQQTNDKRPARLGIKDSQHSQETQADIINHIPPLHTAQGGHINAKDEYHAQQDVEKPNRSHIWNSFACG
jgi:hypothetical protein